MSNDRLPVPVENADSLPYWRAAREERLLIRRCRTCQTLHFMPRHLCPSCWSEDMEWIDASGAGTVHSFTVMRRASDPAFADKVPYVVALVELAEGPRMMANIVGADALDTAIGDGVHVVFERRGPEARLPQFARSAGDGSAP